MKVAIYTLGCKVNQYETQAMEQTLRPGDIRWWIFPVTRTHTW